MALEPKTIEDFANHVVTRMNGIHPFNWKFISLPRIRHSPSSGACNFVCLVASKNTGRKYQIEHTARNSWQASEVFLCRDRPSIDIAPIAKNPPGADTFYRHPEHDARLTAILREQSRDDSGSYPDESVVSESLAAPAL